MWKWTLTAGFAWSGQSRGPISRTRWKIASPNNRFSAADLEVTPAEFTCSTGARCEVNPVAKRFERAPVDVLAPGPDHEPLPSWLYLKQSDFLAHRTSDHCPGCRAPVSGGRAQGHTEESGIRVEEELKKTEVGKVSVQAAAVRVADAPTGRAAKRVRLAEGT